MDKTVVYTYRTVNVPPKVIRQCPKGGVGRIAFRIERPKKDFNGRVEIQCDNNETTLRDIPFVYKVTYACCSPLDNFSRRAARSLTDTRAYLAKDSNDAHAQCYLEEIRSEKKLSIREVVNQVLGYISRGYCGPHWIRKSEVI